VEVSLPAEPLMLLKVVQAYHSPLEKDELKRVPYEQLQEPVLFPQVLKTDMA
jgi:hypothetical protein